MTQGSAVRILIAHRNMTYEGDRLMLAPKALLAPSAATRPTLRILPAPAPSDVFWDAQRCELRVGEELVKKFRRPADIQQAILIAFAEQGWPPRIDDPLPP